MHHTPCRWSTKGKGERERGYARWSRRRTRTCPPPTRLHGPATANPRARPVRVVYRSRDARLAVGRARRRRHREPGLVEPPSVARGLSCHANAACIAVYAAPTRRKIRSYVQRGRRTRRTSAPCGDMRVLPRPAKGYAESYQVPQIDQVTIERGRCAGNWAYGHAAEGPRVQSRKQRRKRERA